MRATVSATRRRQLVLLAGRCAKASRSVQRMAESARGQGLYSLQGKLDRERHKLERIISRIRRACVTDEEGRETNERGWRMDGCMAPRYREQRGYELRQAVRYNQRECADLIAQWDWGADMEEIAEWHQRTPSGIFSQLRRMGARGIEHHNL